MVIITNKKNKKKLTNKQQHQKQQTKQNHFWKTWQQTGAAVGAAHRLGGYCSSAAAGKHIILTVNDMLMLLLHAMLILDAQAEKRRQSGLPWLLVTALMISAQLVGASLAATDFGAEYNVNDDGHQIKTDL